MNVQIFPRRGRRRSPCSGRAQTGLRVALGALALALLLFVVSAPPTLALALRRDILSPAARVAAQLSTPISTIVGLTDYTARSDPERLLGLPGQYVAKADFYDSNGVAGTVEVFATSNDRARRQYGLGPGDQAAYIWYGRVLLRLFGYPTNEQLQAYQSALNAVYLP